LPRVSGRRTFDEDLRLRVRVSIERTARGITQAHGASFTIDEAALPTGVALLVGAALALLGHDEIA
jgi:hypothetical protein